MRVKIKGLKELKRLTKYLINYLDLVSALSLIPALKLFIVLSRSLRPQRNLNYEDSSRPAPYCYLESIVKEKKKRKKKEDKIEDKFILIIEGLYIYNFYFIFININIFFINYILLAGALLIISVYARSSDLFYSPYLGIFGRFYSLLFTIRCVFYLYN